MVMPKEKNANSDAVMTLKEVAEYLKVTEKTIYRLTSSRKIPAFKVGVTWRFLRAEIDQWIRQHSSREAKQAE